MTIETWFLDQHPCRPLVPIKEVSGKTSFAFFRAFHTLKKPPVHCTDFHLRVFNLCNCVWKQEIHALCCTTTVVQQSLSLSFYCASQVILGGFDKFYQEFNFIFKKCSVAYLLFCDM